MSDVLLSRRHPAHTPVLTFGNRSPLIFLTVCAKDRKAIFAHPDVHDLLVASWHKALRWRVGRYLIMPDHIHLFCVPVSYPPESLHTWVKYWKTLASRVWPRPVEQPIWQEDAWDTQLRKGESYAQKWTYVRQNPVRAGLVANTDAWLYQGELETLSWHDP